MIEKRDRQKENRQKTLTVKQLSFLNNQITK